MVRQRSPRECDEITAAPDVDTMPPPYMAGASSELSVAIYTQMGGIQQSIGEILATQKASLKRLGDVESKVATLNRLVWMGMGVGVLGAAFIASAGPIVRFLLRTGLVIP